MARSVMLYDFIMLLLLLLLCITPQHIDAVVVVVVVVVVVYYTSVTITTTRFIEIDYEVCVKIISKDLLLSKSVHIYKDLLLVFCFYL